MALSVLIFNQAVYAKADAGKLTTRLETLQAKANAEPAISPGEKTLIAETMAAMEVVNTNLGKLVGSFSAKV